MEQATPPSILYLHGFNSSPQSHKARLLGALLARRGLADHYQCPALPALANDAIAVAESALMHALAQGHRVTLLGSSLGGFYATWLAERHDCQAVLINPAIDPHRGLRKYLGPQRNLYTGEAYTLEDTHLEQWARLVVPAPDMSRYLLLVETADETLDYREAVARYAGARQIVVPGGDHSFQSFERLLPEILAFAGFIE